MAALLASLTALVLVTGCAASSGRPASAAGSEKPAAVAAVEYPLTITDDASRTVTVSSQPKRIVSLAPADTEIVNGLGLMGEVVGVTTYDDYPVQVKGIAEMGDFTTPNLEAIAAAKPDVVLVTGGVQADVIGELEDVGAKVVVIDPQDLDGVYRAIELVGRVLGVPEKGASVVAGMRVRVAEVTERLAGAVPVTAFVEIGWNPLYTTGSDTLLDDLLVRAGGTNVVSEKGYVAYSVERLVKDQPTVYLGTLSSIGDTSALAARPGYTALSAVRSGKVFALSDDLVSRPGPRVVDGLLEIAKALHPGLFQ